ncbi:MAG: glutaredoxin family protein [Candidatus Aenigmatarchaeota archaeon]
MNLKLYSSYGCPRSSRMKEVLDELGVEYEELDIDRESEYREELNDKMGNADRIPVLEKEGEIVHVGSVGSKEKVSEELGLE